MEHSTPHKRRRGNSLHELYRLYLDCFAAMAAYTYRAVMLHPIAESVSALLGEMAEARMRDFVSLGALLRDRDYSPAINMRLRQMPIALQGKSPAQAAVITQQTLLEAISEERRCAEGYRAVAERESDKQICRLLATLCEEAERRAATLSSLQRRCSGS
ncbi:MAG: hypothetical protein IKD28_05820 [Clostridia bacterium]|nr:hypothetical protein [Clostridia bacterium]